MVTRIRKLGHRYIPPDSGCGSKRRRKPSCRRPRSPSIPRLYLRLMSPPVFGGDCTSLSWCPTPTFGVRCKGSSNSGRRDDDPIQPESKSPRNRRRCPSEECLLPGRGDARLPNRELPGIQVHPNSGPPHSESGGIGRNPHLRLAHLFERQLRPLSPGWYPHSPPPEKLDTCHG